MTADDLPLVQAWMARPHVARWWLEASTAAAELDDLRRSVAGAQPTTVLLALEGERPVGWVQWYRYRDYAADAPAIGADLDEVGIDYALGEVDAVGRGVGTRLVAAVLARVRSELGPVGFIVDPSAGNPASRRVLENNGFELVDERKVDGVLVAIYRLAADG
jgi:aminoglycoside 6'-N-acetyltransferase